MHINTNCKYFEFKANYLLNLKLVTFFFYIKHGNLKKLIVVKINNKHNMSCKHRLQFTVENFRSCKHKNNSTF